MALPSAGHLAALLLALVLALPAHSAVTKIQITKMYSPAGVDWDGDDLGGCISEGVNKPGVTCDTRCYSITSGQDSDWPNPCYADWGPTCDGKWCAANYTLVVDTDSSPSSSNMKFTINAASVYNVKQYTPVFKTSSPYTTTYKVQIGTAVSVGRVGDYSPLITFSAAQGSQGAAITTATRFKCQSLDGAKVVFSTPKVNCAAGGVVEANATVSGCPAIFVPEVQYEYVQLFDGRLAGPTFSGASTLNYQYDSNTQMEFGSPRIMRTTSAGNIRATFYRTGSDEWPAGVTNMKIGHRFEPTSPWTLSANRTNSYVDLDGDGWGQTCDCDDADAGIHKNCPAAKRK